MAIASVVDRETSFDQKKMLQATWKAQGAIPRTPEVAGRDASKDAPGAGWDASEMPQRCPRDVQGMGAKTQNVLGHNSHRRFLKS